MTDDKCPEESKHTPCPRGYVDWHVWADEMEKTHEQIKCDGCERFVIWKRKETE